LSFVFYAGEVLGFDRKADVEGSNVKTEVRIKE
jgi:hypothetical protein